MANEVRHDLINKWDVVNKLIQLENNYQFYKEQWDADVLYRRICELEIGIGKTPTVDAVEVVHARWENVQNGKGCCSNCNRLDSIDNLATHCRYCGAKMVGERRKGE